MKDTHWLTSNSYETAASFVLEHPGAMLVHGYHITPNTGEYGGKRVGHAWAWIPGKGVFDDAYRNPVWLEEGTGLMRNKEYYFWSHNVPLATYTRKEMVRWRAKEGHWGPWDEASPELIDPVLKVRLPRMQRRLTDFELPETEEKLSIKSRIRP